MAERRRGASGRGDGGGEQPSPSVDTSRGRRLRLLVTVVVALEALVLIGLSVLFAVQTVVSSAAEPLGAVFLVVMLLVAGIGVAVCARGLASGERWARAPVLTWQIVQAGVAMPLSSSALWYLGIPLLAMAVFVGALLLTGKVISHPAD